MIMEAVLELKEFISETLVQIMEGVQAAIDRRRDAPDVKGVINPIFGETADAAGDNHIQKVDFDVAVTVTEKKTGTGKAGIRVLSLELGGELGKAAEQSTASHIKFSIPFVPPAQLITPLNPKTT